MLVLLIFLSTENHVFSFLARDWIVNAKNEGQIKATNSPSPPPYFWVGTLHKVLRNYLVHIWRSVCQYNWYTGFRHRGSTLGHCTYQSLNIIIIIIIIFQRRRPICLVMKSKQRNLVVSLKSTMMLNGQSSAKTWNINISMFRKHQQYQLLVD